MRAAILWGLFSFVALAIGCNDQVTTLTGFVCASCTNENGVITNLGPTASQEACEEYGVEYRCAGSEFVREGQCGETIETRATCIVAECMDDPTEGCPSE